MTNIPEPSSMEVDARLKEWNGNEEYLLPDKCLHRLFVGQHQDNTNIDHVLLKVCVLDNFYGTNLYKPVHVAKHIVGLKIDDALRRGEPSLVNLIAHVEMSDGRSTHFYSFATKYCSQHVPDKYSIYDKYVEKMLLHFMPSMRRSTLKSGDLRNYTKFLEELEDFVTRYKLDGFSRKEIDQYLWLAGKQYFKTNPTRFS